MKRYYINSFYFVICWRKTNKKEDEKPFIHFKKEIFLGKIDESLKYIYIYIKGEFSKKLYQVFNIFAINRNLH